MSQTPAPPAAEEADDAALLAAIVARDRAAFAVLFRRYGGRVRAYFARSGLPRGEADEAAQEVMLSVWRRAETFDPARAAASTWIYAIARNRRVDMARRRRPEPDPDDPQFQPDPAPPADAAAAVADRDRALRAAIATLGPEQLEVVRLAFYDGLSHAEVAQALALPLGTVKSRLRLAMTKLRGVLGAAFAEELLDD